MDDFSAARMAAYKCGEGAKFDDQQAGRAERRKARGPDQRSSFAKSPIASGGG